jgi:GAF domain-containing protein
MSVSVHVLDSSQVQLVDLLIVPVLSCELWLLWDFGLPLLFIAAVLAATIFLYTRYEQLTFSNVVQQLLFAFVRLFFREFDYRGRHKFESLEGPLLFVCAPHGNAAAVAERTAALLSLSLSLSPALLMCRALLCLCSVLLFQRISSWIQSS